MRIASIDPGRSGAVGLIDTTARTAEVYDIPIVWEGKTAVTDARGLANILDRYTPDYVVLEEVGYMPGDGAKGAFSFGDHFGTIKGVVLALGFTLVLVAPQVWKGRLGLIGKDKLASHTLARELFPGAPLYGSRGAPKIDRAEALLMGFWWHAIDALPQYEYRRVTTAGPPGRKAKSPARSRKARRPARGRGKASRACSRPRPHAS